MSMRSIFRRAFLSLLVVTALTAVAATSALAASTNNPLWRIKGALLASGHTAEVTAGKISGGVWRITNFGITTECSKVKFKTGAVITGSTAPAAGTANGTLVFEGCSVAGFSSCTINGKVPGTITSEALTATLAFATKEAAEKETGPYVVVLKPTSGKVFMKYLEEGECPFGGTHAYEGEVALSAPEGGTELVEHAFEAPSVSITTYYVNSAGKTVQKTGVHLTGNGGGATLGGLMKVELVSKELWSVVG